MSFVGRPIIRKTQEETGGWRIEFHHHSDGDVSFCIHWGSPYNYVFLTPEEAKSFCLEVLKSLEEKGE